MKSAFSRVGILVIVVLLCVPIFGVNFPIPMIDAPNTSPVQQTSIPVPGPIQAKIIYPRQHIPAIILNGSQVELEVKAPFNITSWDVSLYREYRTYSLANDLPVYNVSGSRWRLNVTIPTTVIRDLYDLNVTISDGMNWKILIEWNAIHVRYEYPTNPLIYHLTDIHVGQGLADQTRSLHSAIYQAGMAEADLIIITGDLTDTGFSSHFQEFKELFRNSRVPILVCAGNHDRDFGDTYGVYISHFGTDYYTFYLGPEIFIVMANSHHSPYQFNSTQLGWAERDFAASNATLKIMAGHAPLMNPEYYTYFLTQEERDEMQRIFDTYNVSVFLSGHLHGDLVNIINDTYWIQTAPTGGSPRMYDPYGHKSRGLRALNFTNYELTSWSWFDLNWSQSIDALYITRSPLVFRDTDIGAYMSVENTLGYGVKNQVVDVLVDPLTGPEVYRVSGGTVLETVNGTDAWLIRISLDVADGETVILRVFTSIAQAPVISAVEYPTTAAIQTLAYIYANVSNPASGIHRVTINRSFADAPFTTSTMAKAGLERFRYYLYLILPGNYRFSITAEDYAGFNVTTMLYSFTVTHEAPSAPELEVVNGVSETGNVTLTWTPSIDPDGFIANYTMQISNTSDFSVILSEHNTSILQYTFTGLSSGNYYFRVRSVDNFDAPSPWSNTESASVELPTTPPPPPPPPPIPLEILLTIIGVTAIIIIAVVVVYFLKIRGRSSTS